MVFSIFKTVSQLLVGSSQSKTAAIAIIIAFVAIALSILFNEVDLNLVERFGLIGVIILFALPSILFGLIDLTCISTKTMEKSFCWYYGWVISIIIVIICILVIFSSIMSMVNYNLVANQTKEIVVDEKEANKIANDLLIDSVEIKENINNIEQYDNNNEHYLLEQFSAKKKKNKKIVNEEIVNEEIEGFVNGGEYQSL
tara:strand:- start:636 stop:1232 length:597 start_codon:yes stop_codon:yes gene_type:complete